MLKNKLGKQAAEIAKAEVPMAELAMCAYRLVVEMITEIATHSDDCKHLVLIGGIQINRRDAVPQDQASELIRQMQSLILFLYV